MMHGESKKKDIIVSEEEKRLQDQKAAKVLDMLSYFFDVRQGRHPSPPEDPLAFTELMAQLCPEIATIYNYRRELLLAKINNLTQLFTQDFNPQTLGELTKLFTNEFTLIAILLKKHPKSYTLWTHRQWTVLQTRQIDLLLSTNDKANQMPLINALQSELQLCNKMLTLDERNFHVWNYRNWLNSIHFDFATEIAYTKAKIEANFSNFSAYHFRSKHLIKHYNSHPVLLERIKVSPHGLIPVPLEVLQPEIDLIQQAIYIQPKEHGIYLYHRWLLGILQPFGALGFLVGDQELQIIFSKPVRLGSFDLQIVDGEEVVEVVQGELKKQRIQRIALARQLTSSRLRVTIGNAFYSRQQENAMASEDTESRLLLPVEFECALEEGQWRLKGARIENEFQQVYESASKISAENIDFMKSVVAEEGNNRFPIMQLLYLSKVYLETLALDVFKNQEKIAEVIAGSIQSANRLLGIENEQQAQYLKEYWERQQTIFEHVLKGKDYELFLTNLFA